MNNAARFFELAHKVIDDRATDAERAELGILLARNPMLKEELEQLRKEARADAEAAAAARARRSGAPPATEVPPPIPDDDRWRTSAAQRPGEKRFYQRWQWWVRLAVVIAVAAFLIRSDYQSAPQPILQVALVGQTDKEKEARVSEITPLRKDWQSVAPQFVKDAAALADWEREWPTEGTVPMVKVAIDPAARQVRVRGRSMQISFERVFAVEKDVPTTLNEVNDFLKDQFKR